MSKAIVTDIISGFHLIGVVNFCLNQGDIREIDAHLIGNMNNEYLLPEGLILTKRLKINIIHSHTNTTPSIFDFLKHTWKRLTNRTKAELPVTWLGHHSYFKPSLVNYIDIKNSNVRCFAFEEGIGSYGGLLHHIKASYREKKTFPILKYLARSILRSSIWIDKYSRTLNSSQGTNRTLSNAVSEISESTWANGTPVYTVSQQISSNAIILFTSPFVELGILSKQQYRVLLAEVNNYVRQNNRSLVIKPHPLERSIRDIAPTEVEIIDSKVPAEVLIKKLEPQNVAGFNSGALITASLTLKKKSINLSHKLPAEAIKKIKLDPSLEKLFKDFVTTSIYDN
ncbi:polysialyltransferase family glycosyltransferase [Pseudomonas sp. abacavir_1]